MKTCGKLPFMDFCCQGYFFHSHALECNSGGVIIFVVCVILLSHNWKRFWYAYSANETLSNDTSSMTLTMSVKSFVKLMFLMFYDMPTLNKVYLILSYLTMTVTFMGGLQSNFGQRIDDRLTVFNGFLYILDSLFIY